MGEGKPNSKQKSSNLTSRPGSRTTKIIKPRMKEISLSKSLVLTTLLVLTISFSAAANLPASQQEIEWVEPFNPETSDMPKHYGSNSDIPLVVELNKDFSNNPGTITWYRKEASDTTWNEIEDEDLEVKWDHDQSTSDADYNAQTFFSDQRGSLFQLNEDDSKTTTIDDNEHTFKAEIIDVDNSVPLVELVVDGSSKYIYEGEYVEVEDKVVRADEITSDDFGNKWVELDLYDKYSSPGDGNYEYKVVAEPDSNDDYHSNKLYLDVSSFNNKNRPYIENVTVNGQPVNHFESISGVDPGATVKADVIEREGDAYNVTLQDRTGIGTIDVQTIPVNEDGTIEEVYSVALDFFFDPFFDTASLKGDNSNRVSFKILPEERQNAVDLFGINGEYQFGFQIRDYGNDATTDGTRKTTDYTLTTDDTVLEPNITAVEGSGDCNTYSTLSSFDSRQPLNCIKVTATDSNDDSLFVAMNLTEVYDGVERNSYSRVANNYHERNGDEYIFNLSKIDVPTNEVNASGDWRADFIASDGISNDTRTVSWSVPWGELNLEMVEPSTDISILRNGSYGMDLRLTCSGGPECVNQNESVSVFWDPKPVQKTSSLPGVFQ